jgi:ribosome-associated heat shock protein Hsp15
VEAVSGGRVHLNGQRIKPSRAVQPGDELEITVGQLRRTVIVRALSSRRGPAKEAEQLYEETEASIRAREQFAEQRRLAAQPVADRAARPTKRERRRWEADARARRGRG